MSIDSNIILYEIKSTLDLTVESHILSLLVKTVIFLMQDHIVPKNTNLFFYKILFHKKNVFELKY